MNEIALSAHVTRLYLTLASDNTTIECCIRDLNDTARVSLVELCSSYGCLLYSTIIVC